METRLYDPSDCMETRQVPQAYQHKTAVVFMYVFSRCQNKANDAKNCNH